MSAIPSLLMWCIIQVTVFGLVAGCLYLTVRRVIPTAGAAMASTSLLLVLMLTLFAASPWPRWQWRADRPIAITESDEIPANAGRTSQASETHEPALPVREIELASSASAAWQAFSDALAQPMATDRRDEQPSVWPRVVWTALAICLAVGLTRFAWGVVSIQSLLRRSRDLDDDQSNISRLLEGLCATMGFNSQVVLRESSDIATPATVGWLTPVILLPKRWREWTPEETKAVLSHELAHIGRRDYLSWLIARLAVAIHFYNPLIHWLAQRLQLEQELAADAAAVRLVGDRQRYLQSLAALALATPNHRLAGPVRTLIPGRSLLMRRVEMLRTTNIGAVGSKPHRLPTVASAAALVLVAVAVSGVRQSAIGEEGTLFVDVDAPTTRTNEARDRIPLTLVPADAVYAFSVRPAELLESKAFDPLMEEIDELADLKDSGISVRDLVEVLLIVRGEARSQPRFVVRCASPESCLTLTNKLLRLSQGQELKVSNNASIFQTPSQRITRLDDSTIVIEPHARSTPNGEQLPPLRTHLLHQWEDDWKQRDDQPVVAAISVAALRQAMSPNDREQLLGGFTMQALSPVLNHTDWAVAGCELNDKLALQATAQCDSAEHAEATAEMNRALLVLGRGVVKQQEQAAVQRLSQMAPQQAELIRPLNEKLFLVAEEFTNNAEPTAEGTQAKLVFRTDSLDADHVAAVAELLIPAVQSARGAARRSQGKNNLKQVALALLNYEATHGHLPPAVVYEELANGTRVPRNWRVEILPFLESNQNLYEQYRKDEPWDSEANRKVLAQMPPVFRSPLDDQSSTNSSYFALTGPSTIFPIDLGDRFKRNEGTRLSEITDGTSNTLAVVEAQRDIPWTKPEDIPYRTDGRPPELGGWHPSTFLAVFVDGHVEEIAQDIDERVLRFYIEKADGNPIPQPTARGVPARR